jgi:hypothetical protein
MHLPMYFSSNHIFRSVELWQHCVYSISSFWCIGQFPELLFRTSRVYLCPLTYLWVKFHFIVTPCSNILSLSHGFLIPLTYSVTVSQSTLTQVHVVPMMWYHIQQLLHFSCCLLLVEYLKVWWQMEELSPRNILENKNASPQICSAVCLLFFWNWRHNKGLGKGDDMKHPPWETLGSPFC